MRKVNIKNTMKKIIVDMDDTATWLLPTWVSLLNKEHNLCVDWRDIKEWDMTKAFPTLSKNQIYAPLRTEAIWDLVIPRGESVSQLEYLHNHGYDIYICTTTDYRNIKPKYEKVIKKYFPFIDWGHMIIASNKQMIMGDFIIDDAPHNLIGGCQPHKILMDMPHNQDCNEKGIVRFSSWKTIRNYIENN